MADSGRRDAIVIGGGISGLVCAWTLQQRGLDAIVLEAQSRAGGVIGTTRENGCLIEAGPNSVLDTTPRIGRLLEEIGIADRRIAASPAARNRFVLRDGRLTALPLSPLQLIASPLFSAAAKLRLLREPFIPPAAALADESIAEFARRRLGPEFLDYAVDPFVGGVYAGDPARLSVRAALPRLYDLEQKHGSLFRGVIASARERKRNRETSMRGAGIFSFRDGMQTLTDALAARVQLRTGARVLRLERDAGGYAVAFEVREKMEKMTARSVIMAAPAEATAILTASLAPQASAVLGRIEYAPLAVIVSAYECASLSHALEGFGALMPACERMQSLGSLFSHSLFANRAPPELALLTTFVGGMRQPELAREDDATITRRIEAENAQLYGAAEKPVFIRVKRWPRAIPQYTRGHAERMRALESAERALSGLFFCSSYRDGVAVGDRIESASVTGERAADFLL